MRSYNRPYHNRYGVVMVKAQVRLTVAMSACFSESENHG